MSSAIDRAIVPESQRGDGTADTSSRIPGAPIAHEGPTAQMSAAGTAAGAPEPSVKRIPGGLGGRWGVLRNRHYRNVWIASFVSNCGNWMEMVGVQWAMEQSTGAAEWASAGRPGSAIMMGYLAAAQTGPIMLLGLLGGVVADRVDRRNLLLYTQTMMMVIAGALCVEGYRGAINPYVLIALGFLNGVVMAFNMPAWQVLTPRLVPRAELADAIVLNGLQFNMSRVLGPALAGALMSLPSLGAPGLFLINTLSFLVVIGTVATTPKAPPPRDDEANPWALILEAFRFSFRKPGPRALVLAIALFSMFATPILRMLPIFVDEVYHENAKSFGLLLAIMGAGAVTGALSIKRVPAWYPRHHLIPLSVMMGGVMTGLTAAAPSLPWASIPMYFCGLFWMWTFNSSFAALQLLVEDRMRGRIMSIANVVSFGAMPIGALMCGVIASVLPEHHAHGVRTQIGMVVLAGILVCCGVVMLIWRTPEVDGMERPATTPKNLAKRLVRGVTAHEHRRRAKG
jgi:MFS family permease